MSSTPSSVEKRRSLEQAAPPSSNGDASAPKTEPDEERQLSNNTNGVEASAPPDDTPPRDIHGFKWFIAVAATLSSVFLYALDNTIVADITPIIVNEFENVDNLPWLAVGFLLGGEAAVLPMGKLYGLFNAKWVFITSAVLFNVGSAVCGAAPNLNALIIGRVIAGLGGNGMYIGVINILSVSTTERERPGYLGLNGVVWGVGTILGPVVGGAFAESSATWRWAFYINLCVAAVCAPVYLMWLPSRSPRPNDSKMQLAKGFDYVGTVLIVGALTSLIMGINFGGALYEWNSGQIIALLVVAIVLFTVFGFQQAKTIFTTTTTRLFGCHLMKHFNAILLFICAAASNCACFIPIYYIPLYFQFTRGDGAIDAAVRLLPYIIVLSVAILANGHFMGKFSYFQPWYIAGGVFSLIGGVLLSRIGPDTPTGEIYGYEFITGLGTGACAQAGYAVIQAVLPNDDPAYSISFMMLAQTGGIALGLAISGAVFVNQAVDGLTFVLPGVPREELQLAVSGTSGAYFRDLSPQQQTDSIEVIVEALSKVFILVYVGAAVTLLCSLLFTKRKLYGNVSAIVG